MARTKKCYNTYCDDFRWNKSNRCRFSDDVNKCFGHVKGREIDKKTREQIEKGIDPNEQ
jgi:hypothetical protein